MRRLLLLYVLKLRALFRPQFLLPVLLLAPLLLGLLAGRANRLNYGDQLVVVVVDEAQSEASKALVQLLDKRGWAPALQTKEAAERSLKDGQADGIVFIDAAYDDYLNGLADEALVRFETDRQSLSQVIVRQTLLLAVEAQRVERLLYFRIVDEYRQKAETVPDDLERQYLESRDYYASVLTSVPLIFRERPAREPRRTMVVGDLTLQVLFLSIFAVVAWTSWPRGPQRPRLASIRGGLAQDFLLSWTAFFSLGLVEIVLFVLAMRHTMGTPVDPAEIVNLLAFFALILALAAPLSWLSSDFGFFLGLFLVFALGLPGGLFMPLPGTFLNRLAQYTPHGWIYGASIGFPVQPVGRVLLVSLAVLLLVTWAEARRPKRGLAE